MNKKQRISMASLVLIGLFATGCSQQQVQEDPEIITPPQPEPIAVIPPPAPIPVPRPIIVAPVVKKVVPRRQNPNCHRHPANSRSKSVRHCHKNPQGQHHYGNRRPAPRPDIVQKKPRVDVFALQRKLKAKGYYKGPIDGVVGNGTRGALQRFQNR